MKKLNEYFKNLGYSKFLLISAIIIYLCDILHIFSITMHFLPTKIDLHYSSNVIAMQGQNPSNFDTNYLNELRLVIINTMSNVFYLFLVYHAFVYFMYAKEKKWGRKYVYAYALTGSILTIIVLGLILFVPVRCANSIFMECPKGQEKVWIKFHGYVCREN